MRAFAASSFQDEKAALYPLNHCFLGKTLPINSRPHSILEQSMVVSTKSKTHCSQVPMKPKTRPKSRQLESVKDKVKSHQKSTKASQQKQIKVGLV